MPPHHGRAPRLERALMNAAPRGRRGFGAFVVTVVTLLLLGVVLRSVGTALSRHRAPISPAALQTPSPTPTPSASPSPSPISTDVPKVVRRLVDLGYPVRCGGDRKPLVALTFDDGPGPLSEATITILRSAGATATFFLAGEVLWSIDSQDSQGDTPDEILARVSSGLRPGAIILLHENRSTTLHVLPSILSLIKARGFKTVTVEQLLQRDPPTVKQLRSGSCP